jgi:hypothetical protein
MLAQRTYLSLNSLTHLAVLACILLLAGCTMNGGWYYEIKKPPPSGCISYRYGDIMRGVAVQICGLAVGKRYQVDAFYGRGQDNTAPPPLNWQTADIPAFSYMGKNTLPIRPLLA